MSDRPILVTLVGVLNAIGAVLLIAAGSILAFSWASGGPVNCGPAPYATCAHQTAFSFLSIFSLVILGLGALDLIVTIGLFKGWTFAWWVAIILAFVGMGSSSISLGPSGNIGVGGIVLDVAIVIILLLPSSREFFDIGQ